MDKADEAEAHLQWNGLSDFKESANSIRGI